MTANTIRSYVQTNLFTDNELQLDEASYSNNHVAYRICNTAGCITSAPEYGPDVYAKTLYIFSNKMSCEEPISSVLDT